MEKSKYIQPEISICNVETDQMMALSRSESPADEHIDVLTNMDKFVSRFWGSPRKGCPFPYPDRSGKAEYSANETIPQAIGLQNKLRT